MRSFDLVLKYWTKLIFYSCMFIMKKKFAHVRNRYVVIILYNIVNLWDDV